MENREVTNNRLKWIVCALCLITFIVIMCGVIAFKVLPFDIFAKDFVVNNLRKSWLTPIVKVITFFGEAKLLIPVGGIGALIGFFILKDRERSFCYISNLIVIGGMNWGIKHIIQRARPDLSLRLVEENGYSFPSGHAMVTTAFYGMIIYYVWNNVKNKLLRNIICAFLLLLIILIAFSRVYLGVHYLSDVIAGSLISVAYLIIAVEFAKRFIFKEEIKNNNIDE